MKYYDIVVIGGGPAGITVSTTAKRHYPEKKVLLIRAVDKSLIPCGIPYMFGTLKDPSQNINPDSVLHSRGIELKIDEAVKIDKKEKIVFLSSGEEIKYDRLVIATGSLPAIPKIPGIELENVFCIRKEWQYLLTLNSAIENAEKIVIVGGGFVGVEIAEQIREYRKKEVTIVEILPYCLYNSFDEEFCFEAERELEAMGINILTGKKVGEFVGKNGKVKEVHLSDGTIIPADLVIVSTGTVPNTKIAEEAGLELGLKKAIVVDKSMQTSDPFIFACGDCAEKYSFFSGKPVPVLLASVAATEARVAGANLYVKRRFNPGVIGVFSAKIGKKAFGVAGLTEKTALEEGFNVIVGDTSSPNRHPSILPGVVDMHVKLVFDEYTGTLIGGQVNGGESVAELINLISACLLHKMTAMDMAAFQMGTHPMLTSSPAGYPLAVAAELASIEKIKGI